MKLFLSTLTKFLAGRVGMYAERADYSVAQYNMYEDAPFEIGFVPLPKGPSVPDEVELAPAIIETFGVPTGAKNPLGGMAWQYFSQVYANQRMLGIGVEEEDKELVWTSFYKTDSSRGKDKKGTGLGLSIVREIIVAHGENIDVISTEGIGSEFIFSLPRG